MIAMIQLADKKGGYVQELGCRVGVRVGELIKSRAPHPIALGRCMHAKGSSEGADPLT
jgi:hypothetical protein